MTSHQQCPRCESLMRSDCVRIDPWQMVQIDECLKTDPTTGGVAVVPIRGFQRNVWMYCVSCDSAIHVVQTREQDTVLDRQVHEYRSEKQIRRIVGRLPWSRHRSHWRTLVPAPSN